MKFAISVLQNRLTLLQNQVIGIDKCNCNKDVEKQIKLKKQIVELKQGINILEEIYNDLNNAVNIKVQITNASNIKHFDREIHYDRKRLIR